MENNKAAERAKIVGQFSVEALLAMGQNKTVYVRSVFARILKAEGLIPAEASIEEEKILYAVHAADGTPLAIVDSRDMAFVGARQYDMEPVSVH
jgi:hypothetical protein